MLIILISILSGIVSGMGIGGGTILIPALTIFLKAPQHIAQSVNLLSFIPTAIVAIISHIKQGNIEKKITFKLILCGVLGAIIGSYFAVKLPGNVLRRLFGGFLLAMGIYEVCCKKKCKK